MRAAICGAGARVECCCCCCSCMRVAPAQPPPREQRAARQGWASPLPPKQKNSTWREHSKATASPCPPARPRSTRSSTGALPLPSARAPAPTPEAPVDEGVGLAQALVLDQQGLLPLRAQAEVAKRWWPVRGIMTGAAAVLQCFDGLLHTALRVMVGRLARQAPSSGCFRWPQHPVANSTSSSNVQRFWRPPRACAGVTLSRARRRTV